MPIPSRLILAVVLPLGLAGCNVFFATDSVQIEDVEPDDRNNSECSGNTCACEDDCEETCEGECEFTCERGATCDITLEEGGEVTCQAGSDCNVECENEDCEVRCEGSCTLQCGRRSDSCGWSECDERRTQCGERGLACGAECPD